MTDFKDINILHTLKNVGENVGKLEKDTGDVKTNF